MKYAEQVDRDNIKKLRELQKTLPPFVGDFFRGIEPRTASRTRIAYAYDLNVFFHFLVKEATPLRGKDIMDITLADLEKLQALDLEHYLEYIKYYTSTTSSDGELEHINGVKGIKRKLSSLKTFYHYFYKLERIHSDPSTLIDMPKLREKEIIRLDPDEVALLLDEIESGAKLTESQKKYHQKTALRDMALITLLLGTGIRVSECVGLNCRDVDFRSGCIHITRKGGKEANIYFGDEVENALAMYEEQRRLIIPCSGHEEAFFLSLQNKRLSVRAIENIVKKYASLVTSFKNITPHKLRSTYGTSLYRETGDIYLVADVLGHTDVNTTKRHYAAVNEEQRIRARNKVRLRSEE